MDLGELLTALENHIFQFAEKQFDINDVPVTLQRLIMEAVYSKFQGKAIEQMITNQIRVEDGEPEEKKVTQSEKNIQETVNILNDFYDAKEGKDGGTESSPAQA